MSADLLVWFLCGVKTLILRAIPFFRRLCNRLDCSSVDRERTLSFSVCALPEGDTNFLPLSRLLLLTLSLTLTHASPFFSLVAKTDLSLNITYVNVETKCCQLHAYPLPQLNHTYYLLVLLIICFQHDIFLHFIKCIFFSISVFFVNRSLVWNLCTFKYNFPIEKYPYSIL